MRPWLLSARQPIRYNIASMMPQATLQPSAPIEHRAHVVAAGLGDAQRAGEREDHDQPEEDFGDAIDRVQDSRGGLFHRRVHRSAAAIETASVRIVRPLSFCTGRLLSLMRRVNAATCSLDSSIGVVMTIQLTPSEQGGVVSEPS